MAATIAELFHPRGDDLTGISIEFIRQRFGPLMGAIVNNDGRAACRHFARDAGMVVVANRSREATQRPLAQCVRRWVSEIPTSGTSRLTSRSVSQ